MAVSAAQVATANALPGRATLQMKNKLVCAPSTGELPSDRLKTHRKCGVWEGSLQNTQHQKSCYRRQQTLLECAAPWCASTCSIQALLDRQPITQLKNKGFYPIIRPFIPMFRILLGTFLHQEPILLLVERILLQEPTVLLECKCQLFWSTDMFPRRELKCTVFFACQLSCFQYIMKYA